MFLALMLACITPEQAIINARVDMAVEAAKAKKASTTPANCKCDPCECKDCCCGTDYATLRRKAIAEGKPLIVRVGKKNYNQTCGRDAVYYNTEKFCFDTHCVPNGFIISMPKDGDLWHQKTVTTAEELKEYFQPRVQTQPQQSYFQYQTQPCRT